MCIQYASLARVEPTCLDIVDNACAADALALDIADSAYRALFRDLQRALDSINRNIQG